MKRGNLRGTEIPKTSTDTHGGSRDRERKQKWGWDTWDEIEDWWKGRRKAKGNEEQRWLQTLPQNSGDRVSCVYTPGRTSAIHKGIVESLDTKEYFRSTRRELLYLFLDSVVIRGCVTTDLHIHIKKACVCWRFLHVICVYSISYSQLYIFH